MQNQAVVAGVRLSYSICKAILGQFMITDTANYLSVRSTAPLRSLVLGCNATQFVGKTVVELFMTVCTTFSASLRGVFVDAYWFEICVQYDFHGHSCCLVTSN
ncbi:hypothetical protein D3C73_1375510 [compost metagenome]